MIVVINSLLCGSIFIYIITPKFDREISNYNLVFCNSTRAYAEESSFKSLKLGRICCKLFANEYIKYFELYENFYGNSSFNA